VGVTSPLPESLDEFFHRLNVRRAEDDLGDELQQRLGRERQAVTRVGPSEVVVAVCSRLVPSDAVPAAALAAFLDDIFDQQRGRGDEQIGLMPRDRLIPAGFAALDEAAMRDSGRSFAVLDAPTQDELLAKAERGDLEGPQGFDASTWFERTRALILLGYGSDPRGMIEMGFPGPSFRSGHVWLTELEVRARAERRVGYLEL
jgi:Gluconate 2-dehydrogenase subunit 3